MLRLAVLNHLLAQRADLRTELGRHHGRIGAVVVPPFRLVFTVGEDGLLTTADAAPDASVTVSPWLLPRLALDDPSAAREVRLDGHPGFAADLARILQSLDWDAEYDLARLIGDIPARRAADLARRWLIDPRTLLRQLAEAGGEYLQEEARLLATSVAIDHFNTEVDRLRDDTARLEKRLDLLERSLAPSP
ncbi:ubiquinone biosynthesis accessory factor UbiJ [Chitinimonas lacunae]|uniref:Ubiquinone biosynthesis accessory factor UbiJ n=1 Tax=Chitinimonas lacunae TaxID=1963018 RepID=A0ABV8MUR7_9NEIS